MFTYTSINATYVCTYIELCALCCAFAELVLCLCCACVVLVQVLVRACAFGCGGVVLLAVGGCAFSVEFCAFSVEFVLFWVHKTSALADTMGALKEGATLGARPMRRHAANVEPH